MFLFKGSWGDWGWGDGEFQGEKQPKSCFVTASHLSRSPSNKPSLSPTKRRAQGQGYRDTQKGIEQWLQLHSQTARDRILASHYLHYVTLHMILSCLFFLIYNRVIHGGRDQSYVAISQGMPGATQNWTRTRTVFPLACGQT